MKNRWNDTYRSWSLDDIKKARGSYRIDYTISKLMSEKLWEMLNSGVAARALGASTPAQAVQMVQAGLNSIYVSGWQVAADVNGDMYPDQSLYTHDSVPKLVAAINNALIRQDKVESTKGKVTREWLVPCIADCEAGFGGALNAFELTKRMIEAGAAAVHFEDQLSSEKKCGHLGGKVLVPVGEFVEKLKAARFSADVCGVPLVIIARTDAESARLLTTDGDSRDWPFLDTDKSSGLALAKRTDDGFYRITGGIEMAIARAIEYAPYADLIWCETSTPNIEEARKFAEGVHAVYPGKLLAYNCSPSFNWKKHLSDEEISMFQNKLFSMGYVFQFVTLAGFHNLNSGMFELASDYKQDMMSGFAKLQQKEFAQQQNGFRAIKHQEFVGTGYFDMIKSVVSSGKSNTTALKDSTEKQQFCGGH